MGGHSAVQTDEWMDFIRLKLLSVKKNFPTDVNLKANLKFLVGIRKNYSKVTKGIHSFFFSLFFP